MANPLPPIPRDDIGENYKWREWLNLVRNAIVGVSGSVPILHNALTSIQGGNSTERYHNTLAEHSGLTGGAITALHYHAPSAAPVVSTAINLSLSDSAYSVLTTASAITITLPAASTARIGISWSITLGVSGYVDIARAGTDTIYLPTNDTTIRITNKGASVTLRCMTATSWSLI